jgi:hypothetical protein
VSTASCDTAWAGWSSHRHDAPRQRDARARAARLRAQEDRVDAALEAVEARRAALLEQATSVPLVLAPMPTRELRRRALERSETFRKARHPGRPRRPAFQLEAMIAGEAETALVNRICIGYLRHVALRAYDALVRELADDTQCPSAYRLLRERAYRLIGDTYPHLRGAVAVRIAYEQVSA